MHEYFRLKYVLNAPETKVKSFLINIQRVAIVAVIEGDNELKYTCGTTYCMH